MLNLADWPAAIKLASLILSEMEELIKKCEENIVYSLLRAINHTQIWLHHKNAPLRSKLPANLLRKLEQAVYTYVCYSNSDIEGLPAKEAIARQLYKRGETALTE